MYLAYAGPWMEGQSEKASETLTKIVEDQQETVDRIGEMILENDGAVVSGRFPLAYASLHYLSFDFLLQRLIEHQKQTITAIEDCLGQLNSPPMAQAVAEEALGTAKSHLDLLVQLEKEMQEAG
jgi:hypothetical protein